MDEISGSLTTKGDFSHIKDLDFFFFLEVVGSQVKMMKSLMHQS